MNTSTKLGRKIEVSGGKLTLSDITLSDGGTYRCQGLTYIRVYTIYVNGKLSIFCGFLLCFFFSLTKIIKIGSVARRGYTMGIDIPFYYLTLLVIVQKTHETSTNIINTLLGKNNKSNNWS